MSHQNWKRKAWKPGPNASIVHVTPVTMQNETNTTPNDSITIVISQINTKKKSKTKQKRNQSSSKAKQMEGQPAFLQKTMRLVDNFTMATSLYKRLSHCKERTDSRSRGWAVCWKNVVFQGDNIELEHLPIRNAPPTHRNVAGRRQPSNPKQTNQTSNAI